MQINNTDMTGDAAFPINNTLQSLKFVTIELRRW